MTNRRPPEAHHRQPTRRCLTSRCSAPAARLWTWLAPRLPDPSSPARRRCRRWWHPLATPQGNVRVLRLCRKTMVTLPNHRQALPSMSPTTTTRAWHRKSRRGHRRLLSCWPHQLLRVAMVTLVRLRPRLQPRHSTAAMVPAPPDPRKPLLPARRGSTSLVPRC